MVESRARAETLFLIGAILLLGYLTYLIFQPFLEWVILGFLLAWLFYKPYLWIWRGVRRRGLAAAIVVFVVLLLFFLPFVVVSAFVFQDLAAFAEFLQEANLEDLVASSLGSLAAAFGLQPDSDTILDAAANIAQSLRDNAGTFVADFARDVIAGVARFLIGLFIFGFTVFYGLVDGPRFVEAVRRSIPLHREEKDLLIDEVRRVVNAVFVGHVLISIIQAAIGTLGFVLLGVPRPYLWGFVMLIGALIPVIGPFIVWVPVGIYLLATQGPVDGVFSSDRTFAALGVLLVVGPIVSTIDNIIRPKLVGARAAIHPFLVLIGALGGIFVFGLVGFVVGPLILALFVAIMRVYRSHWEEVPPPTRAVAGPSPEPSASPTKRRRAKA